MPSDAPDRGRRSAADETARAEMVALPATGRVFTSSQRVRLADVSPTGRMRLDGIARHLQDVAADDSLDSGLLGSEFWVVRRTTMVVHRWPTYRQLLDVATWCGGLGSHWAERRTRLADADSGELLVDAAALWVKVDAATMRPARVGAQFLELYAEAAAGRTVSAKLSHGDPRTTVGVDWPLRVTDFDALGHVNNAVAWESVEEMLDGRVEHRRPPDAPLIAEIEYRTAIESEARLSLVADPVGAAEGDLSVDLWLVDLGPATPTVAVSATVRCGQPASS